MVEKGNGYQREFLEEFPGGVIVLDSERKIKYFNKEMGRILGKDSERIIEEEFGRIFKGTSKDTFEYRDNKGKKVVLRGKLEKKENMHLGCFTNVSDLDRYKDLFDGVPAGMYRTDEKNRIVMANDGFAKIFGHDSAEKIKGRNVLDFYLSEEDMEKFIEDLKREKSVKDYILDMKTKDGKKIIVSVSSSLIENDSEDETDREGTVLDVTEKMEYLRALEEMPTGYYKVEYKQGKEEIIKCNKAFAELFGYPINEIIGIDIKDLYANPEEEGKFMQDLRERDRNRRALTDYELKVKRKDGTEFYIEIDCHLIKDTKGREIGRHGTVRDITHKILLKKTLKDMDKFIHQYITPLINIEISTDALVSLLQVMTGLKYERVKLLNPSERTADEFAAMLEDTFPLLRKINIPDSMMEDIEFHLDKIKMRKELFDNDSSLMDLWTREEISQIMQELLYISEKLQGKLPENISNRLKKVEEKGRYILQIYTIKQQQRIFSTAKLTHKVIESLRFYLVKGWEKEFDFREKNVYSIINRNMELLYAYAQQKGLNFVYKGEKNVRALIAEDHFDRVISNLLMNAIKYSYRREDGFINITVEEKGEEVKIEISNYGVPVRKDELNEVFEYGYRGVFSKDWNRMGSGIGLADAKTVIGKHGGRIEIESVPSQRGYSGRYDIPYITTIRAYIPKGVDKNEEDIVDRG